VKVDKKKFGLIKEDAQTRDCVLRNLVTINVHDESKGAA